MKKNIIMVMTVALLLCIMIICSVLVLPELIVTTAPVVEYDDLVMQDIESKSQKTMKAFTNVAHEMFQFGEYIEKVIEEKNAEVRIIDETAIDADVYVNTYLVNVREEPTTESAVVDRLSYQNNVTAVAAVTTNHNEDWVYVTTPYVSGYIKGDYVTDEPPLVCLGSFSITYYCPCEKCCDVANRPTASGVMPTAGRTVAADKSIPFGTRLIIDGHEYVVEDRGGLVTGNHIDIYCSSHEEALSHRSKTVEVYSRKTA